MWRLLYLPIFLAFYFIRIWIPLYLIGWILIPLAAACGAYKEDPTTGLYHFTWPIMALYDNANDGIYNNSYWPTITNFYSVIWRWCAMRNPLASITKIPLIHCYVNPAEIGFTGDQTDSTLYDTKIPQWFSCWCGFFSCFYYQFNWGGINLFGWQIFPPGLYLFWIGSKLVPKDSQTPQSSYGIPRTYNTIQFNRQS
jgi:hypothetical protein